MVDPEIHITTESDENHIKPIIETPFTHPFVTPTHHHNMYNNNIHSSTLNHSISRNKDHDEIFASSTSSPSWPNDVDIILERIRCNSIILSDYHKLNYFYLHSRLKYFRIPVIIISAFASVFNIGLQPFMDQGWISIICCLMSLVTGLIGSIELFLQIQKRMESDLTYSRDYYLLAIDIYKVLSLDPKNRNGDGGTFLDDKFNIYRKMVENSNILDKKIIDQLAPIDTRLTRYNEVGIKPNETAPNVVGGKVESIDVHDHTHHKQDKDKDKDMNNFHSYFWKPNQDNHETESIDTEDRFQIYCDLVQKSDYLEEGVLEKLTPILISHRKNQEYNLSMEDRMRLFCYFLDNADKFKDSNGFIDKMKPILMSDFFRSPDPMPNTDLGIEDKFKLYQTITEHRNILDDSALDKIKHVLMNDIKVHSNQKKDSARSWIQSIRSMLRSKSSDSNQPIHKTSSFLDTLKIRKEPQNNAPIHNLYNSNVTNVFEENQIDNIPPVNMREQSQVFTTKVNDMTKEVNIMGNLKPLREVSNTYVRSNNSKNIHNTSGKLSVSENRQSGKELESWGRRSGKEWEFGQRAESLQPKKSSHLYSINIPRNRADEISFIQGNSEV